MRLDHLLSREPVWGMRTGLFLVGCVFLVPALSHCLPGWWVWVRFGLGIKVMQEASMLSGSRSTPVGRVAHDCWHRVCLVLVVVWCVVCDLYSG